MKTTSMPWRVLLSAGLVPELSTKTVVRLYLCSEQLRLRYSVSMNASAEMLHIERRWVLMAWVTADILVVGAYH